VDLSTEQAAAHWLRGCLLGQTIRVSETYIHECFLRFKSIIFYIGNTRKIYAVSPDRRETLMVPEDMTSRERVRHAINHETSDRVPIDLGSTAISGLHVVELNDLRHKLNLPQKTPKALDPMIMTAEVDDDLMKTLKVDCVGIYSKFNNLGIKNENFKKWRLPNGLEILVPGDFTTTTDDSTGKIFAYPKGDTSVLPSAFMSPGGLYFDNLVRQEDLDEKTDWNARADYDNMYTLLSDEELSDIQHQADDFYQNTEYALIGGYGGGGLGDIFHVPGPWMKDPKGVRDPADWYMSMSLRPDYLKDLFEMQTEIALENLKLYYEAVGNKIEVMVLSGTDFAHQQGLFISPDMYRELFMPYYKKMTSWIHDNTTWKIFMHSCGSVTDLIPEFIEAGFDILNPVQVSAKNMDAVTLKEKFGKSIVFWGGACDPQNTLPYGTPEQVYEETKRNVEILSRGGGLVGANVHNIQYGVPVENVLAEFQAIRDCVPQPA
jgi:uroporphyrinogen-III decarboxylase